MTKTSAAPPRRVLAAGFAVLLLTGIPSAWGVFQQPVQKTFGLDAGGAGLAFALLVAAWGAGCIPGGLLQDARGPRPAALAGAALLGAGFLLAAVQPGGAGVTARFCLLFSLPAGLGCAFLSPAVLACAQKWYADKKGLATGLLGAGMGLSGAFYTVAVRAAAGRWGLRRCLAGLGVLALAAGGAGAFCLRDPPADPNAAEKTGVGPGQMVRSRDFWLCAGGLLLAAPPMLLFSPDILALAESRGMPRPAAGWCVAIGSAAGALGRLACPPAGDALGRKRVACAAYAGLAGCTVWFALARGGWVGAAYAGLSFFYAGGAALQPAWNSDLFGLRRAGVNYGFLALGMSAGSLASWLGVRLLPPPARPVSAGLCAAGALACFALVRPKPKRD